MRDGTDARILGDLHAAPARYATWLARGTAAGFVAMALAFVVYVAGMLDPHVPLEAVPALWSEPASSYLDAIGLESGWGWAALVHKADMLSLLGIALLSGCSVLALAAVIPVYARQRDRALVVVCLLEIAVMALAASNLIGGAH
jgi:hypothetical protein